MSLREERWSEAIAVGSLSFVNKVKNELAFKAAHREVTELDRSYALREQDESYGANFGPENEALSSENTLFLNGKIPRLRRLSLVRPSMS